MIYLFDGLPDWRKPTVQASDNANNAIVAPNNCMPAHTFSANLLILFLHTVVAANFNMSLEGVKLPVWDWVFGHLHRHVLHTRLLKAMQAPVVVRD